MSEAPVRVLSPSQHSAGEESLVVLTLKGTDRGNLATLDFSRFLYQVSVLYEATRIVADPTYADYRFPKSTFLPQRSRLKSGDQLRMVRVKRQSPWELVTYATANLHAPAAFGLYVLFLGKGLNWSADFAQKVVGIWKTIEETRNIRLDRQEKEARIADESSNESRLPAAQEATRLLNRILKDQREAFESRGALKFRDRSVSILRRLHFRATDIELTIMSKRELEEGTPPPER